MAKKILLVDDEPLILKGLKYSLEQDGYETQLAADGEEALDKFYAQPFDLILLDVMLPRMSGIEVCQRIRGILRRVGRTVEEEEQKIVAAHDMRVNINNRSVTIGGQDINLTAKEFDLLQLFITNRGRVFAREELLKAIWKYDYLGDLRTVDVHIRRLREKIERNPAQPEFIFTKWGVGYYFTDKD